MNPGEQNYWQGGNVSDVITESEHVASAPEVITWEASEYIHHQKSFNWYLICVGLGVVLSVVTFLFFQSWTFTALIIVITISLVVFAKRPPRTLSYRLSSHSLTINETDYPLTDFRAFGVIQEGPLYSVVLVPTKRFMPSVNVYFPAEYGEEIVDQLGARLPMEHFEPDFIDRFMRQIRF